jgi:UDP-galactopyranose mutase
MEFDFLIVGSGFFGSICAHELNKHGYKVCVIEKRPHIGGNCYTQNRSGINVHEYGIHVFHTSNKVVWDWINQFTKFHDFILNPVACYKGETYSLPFNMWTFSKIYGINNPSDLKSYLSTYKEKYPNPSNLEEMAKSIVGDEVYERLIYGYTKKQWMKEPKELPKEIIQRLPIRFTYDGNYFNDTYQGIPIGGYTQIFEKLLDGIEVRLNTDYFADKEYFDSIANKVIYTGAIDKFYDYQFGQLEYKSTEFLHKELQMDNYQGCPMMNFTDESVQFTRIIEHKHFEKVESNTTWISFEYPTPYIADKVEPYYPVNDSVNNEIYQKYASLNPHNSKYLFGGRLAEYKYYDMHQVIESALNFTQKITRANEKQL